MTTNSKIRIKEEVDHDVSQKKQVSLVQGVFSHKYASFFVTLILMLFVFGSSFFIAYQSGKQKGTPPLEPSVGCIISGCNNEICQDANTEPATSICIYDPKYECFKSAKCERQEAGECAWTQTEELKSCLSKY